MLFSKITDEENEALKAISAALNIPPDWLYSLIDFESKWNPAAKNPYSGARGLIQFVNSTARGMGYDGADDLYNKNPTRISQIMGPVYDYLKRYMPFPSEQSFVMAVFYPKYRAVPPDTLFPDSVIAVNPGIKTPADYIRRVFPDWTIPAAGGVVAVCVVVLFLLSQKG